MKPPFTMEPPMFINQADYIKGLREQRAINAEIRISGRFWCWHDYTYMSYHMEKIPWPNKYVCVKCGKADWKGSREHSTFIERLTI